MAALAARAQAEPAAGNRAGARALLNEAHDVAAKDRCCPPLPTRWRRRGPGRAPGGGGGAPRQQLMIEELTDRERSILRALPAR